MWNGAGAAPCFMGVGACATIYPSRIMAAKKTNPGFDFIVAALK